MAATRPHRISRPSREPTIYFIGMVEREAVTAIKIGYSTNVPDRLSTLQTASARPLELLATMPGTQYQERVLHGKFERLHGEWFRPTHDLVEYIHANADVKIRLRPADTREPPRQAAPHPSKPQNAREWLAYWKSEYRRQAALEVRRRPTEPFLSMAYHATYVMILCMAGVFGYYVLSTILLPAWIGGIYEYGEWKQIIEWGYSITCVHILTWRHAREWRQRVKQ